VFIAKNKGGDIKEGESRDVSTRAQPVKQKGSTKSVLLKAALFLNSLGWSGGVEGRKKNSIYRRGWRASNVSRWGLTVQGRRMI